MTATVLVAHPSPELYGSDRMMLESIDAMVTSGCSVVVTLPTVGPLIPEIVQRGAVVRLCPTPVLRRAYMSPLGLLRLGAAAAGAALPGGRLLRELHPDVVYVSTLTIPGWLALSRLQRIPTVCHVHEAEGSASRQVRTILATPLRLADRLVLNSRFALTALTSVVPSLAERSTIVYNGVAGPLSPVAPRSTLTGGVRLVFVGRLSERKGVLDAVEAVRILQTRGQKVRLDIVGSVFPGYEHIEVELSARTAALIDPGAVVRHGFVADIWSLVADADIMLVPSRGDEPFGNTAVEAALAARPVVVSNSSGLIEAVEGLQSARAVTPGAPAEIADAVEGLVRDWDDVREQALSDASAASQKYSPRRYGRGIMSALESAAPSLSAPAT